jgi:integrase
MSGVSCLYRRPSGIYAVRLAVPVRLRHQLGRGEIHVSTGLRDWNAAKLAGLKIQLQWRARFMTLDIEKLATANPLLKGDGLISIPEAAKAIGLSASALLGELLHDRATVYAQARNWKGWSVSNLDDICRDYDGAFILNDVEDKGTLQAYSGPLRCHDSIAALGGLMADEKFNESVFLLTSGAGAFFPEPEQTISLPTSMALKSAIEHVRVRLAAGIPPEHIKPAIALAKPIPESIASPPSPPSFKHAGKRFSELFDLVRNHRNWGEDQKRRMATEAGLFIGLMGDPTLGEIELETIHEYAKRLSKLPTNIYLSRRAFKVESMHELIAVAERKSLLRKNANTVRSHVGRVAEILNFAAEKGMMPGNPASGFQREWSIGKKARAQDERDEFTADELALIFSQEWFSSGAGAFSDKGSTDWRPFYFWLPLLALVTGGRLNELAQLYLDDVRQSENGAVWYLDFNLDGDKFNADEDDWQSDKSLKTVNAIRVVPLHEVVVKAGLPEYVATLRQAGHKRLFPELSRDEVKGYGKPAGKWFNENFLGKKLGIERNGRKTFHSLRHNFATAVGMSEREERVVAQLMGHQRGKTESGKRYIKDRNAEALKPIIDRLTFPCLEGIGKFCIPAAIRAIKYAERFKAAVARGKAAKAAAS